MKSSIKFREDKGPLLRAKLPFTVASIPLSSGIALGSSHDIAVHVGTLFTAGPAIKLAFKPNNPSPLSVILKTGFGLWGSPNGGGAFTLTAEFQLIPKGVEPLFSLRLRPRAGDFSIIKDIPVAEFLPSQQKQVSAIGLAPLELNENGEKINGMTSHKMENGTISSAISNGNFKTVDERDNGPSRNGLLHFNTLVNGTHGPLENQENQVWKSESVKAQNTFSLGGAVCSNLQDSRLVAHTSLPLGSSQARVNIRWGLKPSTDMFQGWDGFASSLTLSKLPSLVLDKVSFEPSVSIQNKKETKLHPDQSMVPVNIFEDNKELAQLAAFCHSMKRQLHLINAENQVLKRAMQDMRSLSGSWNANGSGKLNTEFSSKPAPLDPAASSLSWKEPLLKETEGDPKSKPSAGYNADVSEFEKAIMNGKTRGKKD